MSRLSFVSFYWFSWLFLPKWAIILASREVASLAKMDPRQVHTAGLINTKFIKGLCTKPRRAAAREAEKVTAEQESLGPRWLGAQTKGLTGRHTCRLDNDWWLPRAGCAEACAGERGPCPLVGLSLRILLVASVRTPDPAWLKLGKGKVSFH